MIVVMKPGSSQKQIDHVCSLVREMGMKDHVIQGTERTVVAVIGDDRNKDRSVFETVDGVEKVVPILAAYKMASKEIKKERSVVPFFVGKADSPMVGGRRSRSSAGRVASKAESQLLETAHAVKEARAAGPGAARL